MAEFSSEDINKTVGKQRQQPTSTQCLLCAAAKFRHPNAKGLGMYISLQIRSSDHVQTPICQGKLVMNPHVTPEP
jgi:hypothetical protein